MKTLLILCVEPNFAPIRTQSFPLLTIIFSTFESRTGRSLKSGSLAKLATLPAIENAKETPF